MSNEEKNTAAPRPKVIIERSTWRNASHGLGMTYLRNVQGFQCCLGFAAKQLGGLRDEEILDNLSPGSLNKVVPFLTVSQLLHKVQYTALTATAMRINDNPFLTDDDRENQLKEAFNQKGIDLEFTGQYRSDCRIEDPPNDSY